MCPAVLPICPHRPRSPLSITGPDSMPVLMSAWAGPMITPALSAAGRSGSITRSINGCWGIEGDLAGTTIKDSVSATVAGPGAVITGNAEASLDWVSTLAPRVGYAFNNWLVYGKVGGAWGHASGTASTAINGMQLGSISVSETVSGWMLGIGAEYALWDNWTAKIEYNMMDFGNSGP